MTHFLGLGYQAATINTPKPDPRAGFDTPEPVYPDVDLPVKLLADPRVMSAHERARFQAAAVRAAKLYPSGVAALIQHEIATYVEFGQALGRNARIAAAVDDILKAPLPT